MYPIRNLEIVPECNDENDNPTCWGMLVCEDGTGRRHFLWICKYDEKEYIVEDSRGNNLTDGKVYKTLKGAKKAAEAIAYRQDESGFFTD